MLSRTLTDNSMTNMNVPFCIRLY